MRSILLLSVNLFSIYEVVLNWSRIWRRKYCTLTSCVWLKGHRMTNSNSMRMVIHFENFLLLRSQILIWMSHCESHSSWNEYITALIWWINLSICSHKIILMRSIGVSVLYWLKVVWWSSLFAIVRNISWSLRTTFWLSSNLSSRHTFLIMAIELLNIETSASLVVSKWTIWSWLKCLILSPSSALSVKMFS